MFSADSLPDNPAVLKALVSAQQAEIEHLKFIIAKFRRMQFGRRSEQMGETITQLELALEELECGRGELSGDEQAGPDEDLSREDESVPEAAAPAKAKPKRKPLPEVPPAPVCWRMFSWPNTAITCRSIPQGDFLRASA